MKHKNNGYTLVELSVTLVIIALLIGGIIFGKSLIRNSELRAITSEYASYVQAIGNFRDKYQALPGDFAAASSVWSGITNGDGDGLITVNVAGTRLDEQFLAWQHLAKSEFIKGNFTGTAGSAGVRDRVVGTNIPTSQLANAGWGLISVTLTDIAGGYGAISYIAPDIPPNHVLWLGGGSITGTADFQKAVLTGAEAKDIDTKSDDGLPYTGKIVVQYIDDDSCASATAYTANSSTIACSVIFKTGY